MRNLCLSIVLLTLVLLAITETSAKNRLNIDKEERNALKSFDVRTKKIKYKAREFTSENNSAEGLQGKKFVRVQSRSNNFHDRKRRSIFNEVNERNGGDKGRFRRNVTELDDFKGAKKSYTKLKLAQTQSSLKNWKNKDGRKYVDEETTKKRIKRRQLNYHVNGGRSKRDDKSDYYAQRRAVMERFYARQKEIAEKYAKKLSTTPKYIYTLDLDTNKELGTTTFATTQTPEPVTKATTKVDRDSYPKQVQPTEYSSEVNNEEDVSGDYDYYTIDDNKPRSNANSVNFVNDEPWSADDSKKDTMKWGTCAGNLVYQHNLKVNVHNSTSVQVNLTASVEGPFCIACIRALPMNKTRATVSFDVNRAADGTFNFVQLLITDFQQGLLSYIIKIWAVDKTGDRCDRVKP
ncbi:uncharacterized protein LOC114880169 [Osmia bicornis bicornis]|uniref:uncharacterized protein LOC114880169 n=1 Tax=Osmia bicornis bicornis TaxID=1437191 RepID=UPI001EAEBFE7|nr:uncharacterized protein LOC114880169 [Osmia bicornis bicornis]